MVLLLNKEREMILKNNYYWFQAALSEAQCNMIIEHGIEEMARMEKMYGDKSTDATTFDHRQKGGELGSAPAGEIASGALDKQQLKRKGLKEEDLYIRDTKVSWLSDPWIYEIFHPYIHQANLDAGWNFEWDWTEPGQFTKYEKGQFYGWHPDSGDQPYEMFDPEIHECKYNPDGTAAVDAYGNKIPKQNHYVTNPNQAGKIRKLSMTCNLTNPDNYDGGNLRFDFGPHAGDKRYHTCTEIRPKGSIIIFPSHVYHQVSPVTRGTRYSMVMWNLGRPFR
jgi:PKHD-type hydroxylase